MQLITRLAVYILIIGLLSASAANASGYTVYGITGTSCGKYILNISTISDAATAYDWWFSGFLTGSNMSKNRATFTDNAANNAWIKKYCEENPLSSLMEAAIKLDMEIDRRFSNASQ